MTDSTNQWFLTELDAAADKTIFSATGIGGSSIALDAAGNIYMAGSSTGTGYPTTPGAYRTTFVQGSYCFGFCQFSFTGNLQHVTKVNPQARRWSTPPASTTPLAAPGPPPTRALPWMPRGTRTSQAPCSKGSIRLPSPFQAIPITRATLTKLDPAGAKVLFSIPVGGGGVQLDSSGSLYVGGAVTTIDPYVKYRIAALAGGCDSDGIRLDPAAVLAQLHHGA